MKLNLYVQSMYGEINGAEYNKAAIKASWFRGMIGSYNNITYLNGGAARRCSLDYLRSSRAVVTV
jgi:hypothetical protein